MGITQAADARPTLTFALSPGQALDAVEGPIEKYIAAHNKNPKPFIWTAKANDILQKVIRANRRLEKRSTTLALSDQFAGTLGSN